MALPAMGSVAVRRLRRARVARAARRGRGAILLYHRVAAPADDPWQLAVSPATFDEHLALLSAEYVPIALSDFVAAARGGNIPERAIAVTFDDGYADNLHAGLPALESHGVPATIYVATAFTGTAGPFWWDELQLALSGAGSRPATLEIELGDERIVVPTASPQQRLEALTGVLQPLAQRSRPDHVDQLMAAVREWAPATGADSRPLTCSELRELAASELIEIGAHTHRHASLPALDRAERSSEVGQSRALLADWLGSAPRSFAYPYGDMGPASRWTVRRAGFDHAVCVNDLLPVSSASPRFGLPRITVVEEPASSLRARIEQTLAWPAGDGSAAL